MENKHRKLLMIKKLPIKLTGNGEMTQKYETSKGCTYFNTYHDEVERVDQIIGNVPYKTVKQSCVGTNCNKNLYNEP